MRATWGLGRIRSLVVATSVALAVVLATAAPHASAGVRRTPPRAASPSEAVAQINGKVVDGEGRAIAGVTVLATPAHPDGTPRPDGSVHPRVESDRDGTFHFSLPPGEYVFVALHRTLAGLTPAMHVLRELDVVLTVTQPTGAA